MLRCKEDAGGSFAHLPAAGALELHKPVILVAVQDCHLLDKGLHSLVSDMRFPANLDRHHLPVPHPLVHLFHHESNQSKGTHMGNTDCDPARAGLKSRDTILCWVHYRAVCPSSQPAELAASLCAEEYRRWINQPLRLQACELCICPPAPASSVSQGQRCKLIN